MGIRHKLLFIRDANRVWFTSKERARFLTEGLSHRGKAMFEMYHLSDLSFHKGDFVIDVGANTGDLLLGFENFGDDINYCAFECSPRFFQLLQLNASPRHKVFQVAAWNRQSIMDLYLRDRTASSSIIQPRGWGETIVVSAICLDEFMCEIQHVKLLKIEAEGCEPEVIKGACEILQRTEYVSVDVGPERGRKQETTEEEVVTLLLESGFKILKRYQPGSRSCILFQNAYFSEHL